MRVAVVGAGGFIGRHLCSFLSSRYEVLSFSSSKGIFSSNGRVGHLNLPENLKAVFYLSQSPHYRPSDLNELHMENVNAWSAGEVALQAEMAGTEKFFYASSGNVYQARFDPLLESSALNRENPYARSKILGEELILSRANKMSCYNLRLFGVFGSHQAGMLVQKIAAKVLRSEPILLEAKEGDAMDEGGLRISYLYVKDFLSIVDTILSQSERFRGPLNLAGPTPISLRELAAELGVCVGKKPQFQSASTDRKGDLIADISCISKLVSPRFTPFRQALIETFRSSFEPRREFHA